MKLNVPLLSQRDPRWANQRLGTVNGTTIGGYGCIITCMTMLARYYGHNLTPAEMDNWLTDNQGYVQGNLYRNDAFGREFIDCSFDRVIFCTATPAPLDLIKSSLDQGRPVVIMVDFDHDPHDGIQTHFVLIVGYDEEGNFIINDPWYGDQVYLIARYGTDQAQAINQINLFNGPVFIPTLQKPTVQPTPEVAVIPVETPVVIPVTTSAGESHVTVIATSTTTPSSDIVGIEPVTPPIQPIPVAPPAPTKPPMDLASTIVWIWTNILLTLKKLSKL